MREHIDNIEKCYISTSEIIDKFIDRCSAYFKNKMIVLPKIYVF